MRRQILTIALVAVFCLGSQAFAGKKGGGGGDETGQNGGGTIYFRYSPPFGSLYSTNDDGSGMTSFPDADVLASYGHPSYRLHGGKRWFVWWDAFYSDSGDIVPLSVPANFDLLEAPSWAYDDASVSFVGRRWDMEPDSSTFGQVVEGGLYCIGYSEDAEGNILPSQQTPVLLFKTNLVADIEGDLRPDMDTHSRSPDGIQFVFRRYTNSQLEIGRFFTDSSRFLYPKGGLPQWSPLCDRIVFLESTGHGNNDITVINSDGSGAFTLVRARNGWRPVQPQWSPTGSHLVYTHEDSSGRDTHIVRIKADGTGATRITNTEFGSGHFIFAIGWRAETQQSQ